VRGFEYTYPTLKVTTELQELITYVSYLYIRWKLEGFNCASYRNCAISRLRTGAAQSRDCINPVRNLEIGTQFLDSENAQRNLKIAQIPRLRGTYISLLELNFSPEFAENGSIFDYIHVEHKQSSLAQRLLWLKQVAEGMVKF